MIKMIPGKMVTFAVLCMLVRVVCTQDCSTCQCCADGKYLKCSIRGNCNNGCIDGYYGKNCKYKCTSQNCLRCHRNYGNYCQKCTPGYYLYNYNCNDCGSQCQSCSSYGCNSCYDGYWGSTCDENCAQNSTLCRKSDGYCLSCGSGYYFYNGKCTTCGIHCAVCDPRGCTSCHVGYWGSTCDENCAQNCASCRTSDGYCLSCGSGYYLYNGKCTTCGAHCACCGSGGCTSCHNRYWGSTCDENCAQNCASCSKSDGYCLSCSPGYWGNTCENPCGHHCLECDEQNGECISCEHGYLGHPCTECSRDMCMPQFDCELCTNISFFANGGVCCLCSLDKCVSCSKALDTVNCKICKQGYYPQSNGQCGFCNSYCFKNECDSSSGVCLYGCINGYWNKTCDKECEPDCLSCNQTDGSCSQCKNNTRHGHDCRQECSATCKNSKCDNNGNCINVCIPNTFGKQCENKCDGSCSPKDNRTSCSEKTGMCLYGCQHGYRGRFCPKDVGNKSEKQTLLTAALGRGLGGGIMALIILAIIAMVWFRKRRRSNTERNTSVHDGDYATVDANLREVELRDLKYETLQETDVHTMNQTTDYSNVSDNVNDNITYQNVHGRSLSD